MTDESPWIEELEAKVEAAVDEIRRLRAENASLEKKLAAAESAETSPASEAGAEDWKQERAEVKKRVEGIVGRLEELLEE